MSEEKKTYQQAERQAEMMNQMNLFHSSPSDFMHTQEESTDESIDTYLEYKQLFADTGTGNRPASDGAIGRGSLSLPRSEERRVGKEC